MAQLSSNSKSLVRYTGAALAVAFVAVSTSFSPRLQAQSSPGVMQSLEGEIQGIFHRTMDSVVQVKTILSVQDAKQGDVLTEALSVGSGFFIDKQGHLLTAASVLRGSSTAVVYWKGKAYEAKSIGQDPRTNIALLKIEAETPSLSIGDPDALKVGSMALAVGYPADSPVSVEYGFISNTDSGQILRNFATTHIRSSVHVQPGQSGSPFLNSKGEVVGIVVYAMEDGSSTFALPITAAQKIQKDLLAYHAPRPGWTGLNIEFNAQKASASNQGIAVSYVFQSSPGHLAGVQSGDVLLKIGDKSIHTPADVMNATFYLSVGETVNYTISRDGENKIIPVKVVPRPSEKELLALKPVPFPTQTVR